MRWPWQPRPGMVRIKARDLIELQREALRGYELEQATRELQVDTARLEAQVLLARLTGLTEPERAAASAIADQPPLTDDAQLHESAFDAAVDAAVWAQRERELAGLGIGTNDTAGGL